MPMNDEHQRSALWSISKSLSFFDEASYRTWVLSGIGRTVGTQLPRLLGKRCRDRPVVTVVICAEDGSDLRSSLEISSLRAFRRG